MANINKAFGIGLEAGLKKYKAGPVDDPKWFPDMATIIETINKLASAEEITTIKNRLTAVESKQTELEARIVALEPPIT